MKGRPLSKVVKEILSEKAKKRWQDPSFREKMSKALTGRSFSDEAKRKMASLWEDEKYVQNVLEGMHKKWEDTEYRNKMLDLLEKRNKDPVFIEKRLKGLIKKPNKPEQRIIDLCKRYNFPFKYVGDGRVIIGTLNPDFIHNHGEKKVIELFGRTFHDPDKSPYKLKWHRQYWGRLAYFAQHGYDCLILWDNELDDEEALVKRIRPFVG